MSQPKWELYGGVRFPIEDNSSREPHEWDRLPGDPSIIVCDGVEYSVVSELPTDHGRMGNADSVGDAMFSLALSMAEELAATRIQASIREFISKTDERRLNCLPRCLIDSL